MLLSWPSLVGPFCRSTQLLAPDSINRSDPIANGDYVATAIIDIRVTNYTVYVVEFSTLPSLAPRCSRNPCIVDESPASVAVTSYTWSENYQAVIAMRQLEDCGVPCDCPRCISAYYRLQRIQQDKEERDLRRPSGGFVHYD